MGCVHNVFKMFFLIMGLFASWPITRKNTHTMDTLEYNVTFPFGLGNGYKGIILAKWYGIMFGAIGNTWELEEHNVIIIGNYWEHRRNKHTRNMVEKISHLPPPQNPKKGKWCHLEPSHWMKEVLIPRIVCHHFWLGQIAPFFCGWVSITSVRFFKNCVGHH